MEPTNRLIHDEAGQGLVEYAMLLGIVVIGTALALDLLGDTMIGIVNQIRIALSHMPWD